MTFRKELVRLPSGRKVVRDTGTQSGDDGYLMYLDINYKSLVQDQFGLRGRGASNLGKLDDFLLYGWGRIRFSPPMGEWLGSERDPLAVAQMLYYQDVDLPKGVAIDDLGGICWG
jgi:hypothetical protein